MAERAWIELDANGWIIFVPGIADDEWGAIEYVSYGSELGADVWAVNEGYKLVGGWEYAQRLDGTTQVYRLIERETADV